MMPLFQFWLAHWHELATLLGQHVVLVAVSTSLGVAAGVPLGIFAARRPRLAAPLVGVANAVQTIPSLAMFGFLLPVPLVGGVGARAALVVLVLYALLPIVRATIVGIAGVDRSVREAGVAMGMTPRQLRDEFRRIQSRLRKTVLLVTHDMAEAMAMADRIGVLDQGRLIWSGPPDAILGADDARVRQLIDAVVVAPRDREGAAP